MPRKPIGTLFFLLFVASADAQTQSIFFKPPTLSPTSGATSGAIVADFSGDGKLDVAYPDGTVLLAKADGTYQSGTPWCTNAQAYCSLTAVRSIATADFNHDGKPDLLVTTPNFLWVLLGNGDGTFQAAVNSASGAASTAAVVADVNGDGKADVMLDPGGSGALAISLGTGDGTFQAAQAGPNLSGAFFIGAADFNGDGKVDLLARTSGATPQFIVFTGHGDGTFATTPIMTNIPPPLTANSYVDFYIGDLNADGKPDVIVSYFGNGSFPSVLFDASQPEITLALFGKGDGTFDAAKQVASRGGLVAIADVNGDGRTDLILAEGPFLDVLLGNGDGTATLKDMYFVDFEAGARPILADFNGDGHLDVFTSGVLFYGNGDGTLKGNLATVFSAGSLPPGVVADFNQDGKPDVAAVTFKGAISIALGDGSGRFAPAFTTAVISTNSTVIDIWAVDLNGDGKLDLLVAATTNSPDAWTTYFLQGNGDGTFGTPLAVAQSSQFGASSVALADLNNDHKPDLIVSDGSGAINIFMGNGDGNFTASTVFFGGLQGGETLVAGDFNGDGKTDLVVGVQTGLNFLPGKGDGTFGTAVPAAPSPGGVTLSGDFNGDGIMDVYGPNVIALGNGDGTFRAGPALPNDQPLTGFTIATDLNADGKVDLVGGSGFQPQLMQYTLGNGDGSFGAPVTLQTSFARAIFGGPYIADANGDGRPDILFFHSGAVVTMLNTLPPPTPDFFETITSPASATVSKGQSATFGFNVAPMAGFQQTVTFICSGAPANSMCTVSPSSAMVSGSTSIPIAVTVSTTAIAGFVPISIRKLPTASTGPSMPLLMMLISLAILLAVTMILATFDQGFSGARLRWASSLCCLLLVASTLLLVSCGGGSSPGSTPTSNSGTAAGTYSIKVTGASGSGASAVSHAVTFTLIVQ